MSNRAKKAWIFGCVGCGSIFLMFVIVLMYVGYQFSIDNYSIPMRARQIKHTPYEALGPGTFVVSFPSRSGAIVPGWYRPGSERAAILILHGLGGTREQLARIGRFLNDEGWGILVIDQRGHGEHPLNLTTFGRAESEDALGAIDWLRQRDDIDPDRIGIYGASLGATTCIHAASMDPDLACAVADSSYAVFQDQIVWELEREGPKVSVPEGWRPFFIRTFKRYEPILIGEWANMQDPVDAVRDIQCPLFLIQGENDIRIQADNVFELSRAAREAGVDVTIWQVQDEGHCSYFDTDAFSNRLIGFFRIHL